MNRSNVNVMHYSIEKALNKVDHRKCHKLRKLGIIAIIRKVATRVLKTRSQAITANEFLSKETLITTGAPHELL